MSANIAIVSAAANLLAALLKKQADSDSAKEAGAAPAAAPEPVPVSLPGRHLLGQFSTRNESFFKHILEIDALVHHYVARPSVRKPLCLLISAPPGSGKSFLVKQLLASRGSGAAGVPFLEMKVANISRLPSKFGQIHLQSGWYRSNLGRETAHRLLRKLTPWYLCS